MATTPTPEQHARAARNGLRQKYDDLITALDAGYDDMDRKVDFLNTKDRELDQIKPKLKGMRTPADWVRGIRGRFRNIAFMEKMDSEADKKIQEFRYIRKEAEDTFKQFQMHLRQFKSERDSLLRRFDHDTSPILANTGLSDAEKMSEINNVTSTLIGEIDHAEKGYDNEIKSFDRYYGRAEKAADTSHQELFSARKLAFRNPEITKHDNPHPLLAPAAWALSPFKTTGKVLGGSWKLLKGTAIAGVLATAIAGGYAYYHNSSLKDIVPNGIATAVDGVKRIWGAADQTATERNEFGIYRDAKKGIQKAIPDGSGGGSPPATPQGTATPGQGGGSGTGGSQPSGGAGQPGGGSGTGQSNGGASGGGASGATIGDGSPINLDSYFCLEDHRLLKRVDGKIAGGLGEIFGLPPGSGPYAGHNTTVVANSNQQKLKQAWRANVDRAEIKTLHENLQDFLADNGATNRQFNEGDGTYDNDFSRVYMDIDKNRNRAWLEARTAKSVRTTFHRDIFDARPGDGNRPSTVHEALCIPAHQARILAEDLTTLRQGGDVGISLVRFGEVFSRAAMVEGGRFNQDGAPSYSFDRYGHALMVPEINGERNSVNIISLGKPEPRS